MPAVKTAVVVPCYKVADHINKVILSIPDFIDHIIVVDDKCPQSSGEIAEKTNKNNLVVIYHDENQGVGGSVITGFKKAKELGCEVIIKMDGDGQMDPSHIEKLIEPLIKNEADYTKGNRFREFEKLKSMPKPRLFGNSILSFLIKFSSGYWDIFDPTNGYTAIHRNTLEKLNLEKISNRYFFESDMLINLNIINAVVKDINIPAKYGEEKSSLNLIKASFQFPPKLLKGFVKRIFMKYFIYDFNMASVYILVGLPLFIFGIVFGITKWIETALTDLPRPSGTIMLAALPIIVSFQMLLQAISIDINSVPKKK